MVTGGKIVEAPKVRIQKVFFEGNQAYSQKKLRKVIKTRKWNWISWLTGSGWSLDLKGLEKPETAQADRMSAVSNKLPARQNGMSQRAQERLNLSPSSA